MSKTVVKVFPQNNNEPVVIAGDGITKSMVRRWVNKHKARYRECSVRNCHARAMNGRSLCRRHMKYIWRQKHLAA